MEGRGGSHNFVCANRGVSLVSISEDPEAMNKVKLFLRCSRSSLHGSQICDLGGGIDLWYKGTQIFRNGGKNR